MTNYATMPAGPEMDRMIAEMVMGWREAWEGQSPGAYYDGTRTVMGFAPSTRIDHAWQVVEKMHLMTLEKETGRYRAGFDLMRIDDKHGGGWSCRFREWHDPVYGETAPLVICRAALIAMEDK